MMYILGIAILWVIMAVYVHEDKECSWKISFILAPILWIIGIIEMVLGKDE